ncbi:hypothetical protein D3C85_1874300 [compost metagenome]
MPVAQGMNKGTRRFGCNPLAVAGFGSDAPVEGARGLHRHEWHTCDDEFVEGFVQLC